MSIILRADLIEPGDIIERYTTITGTVKDVAQYTDDEVFFQFEDGTECRVPARRGILITRRSS